MNEVRIGSFRSKPVILNQGTSLPAVSRVRSSVFAGPRPRPAASSAFRTARCPPLLRCRTPRRSGPPGGRASGPPRGTRSTCSRRRSTDPSRNRRRTSSSAARRARLRPQILRGVCGAEGFGVQDAIDVVQIDGRHGRLRNGGEAGETGDTDDHRREKGGMRSRATHGWSGPGGDAPSPRAPGHSRRSRRGPRSRSRGPRASDACRRRGR